jgi:hypothetical protein
MLCICAMMMLRERVFVKRHRPFWRNFLGRSVIDKSRLAGKQPLSVSIDGAGGKLAFGAIAASRIAYAHR